ncbi:MAG: TonB family protein [Pyrinomonadaceae bacterium]
MPPKVSRLLFLTTTVVFSASVLAQQPATEPTALNTEQPAPVIKTAPIVPTTQDRLLKVRGMIAARQLPGAAFELEKLKKETSDDALQSVVRTMLIGVYLEQPNYDRAKDLLEDTYKRNKNRKNGMENIYLPVASQFIRGAENQLERYKRLGFNLADPKLPAEAVADLDRWRKMLETIVEQAKQMSADEKKSGEALALLEEAANARAGLARDNYEAAVWHNAMDDTREMIANAQSKVTDVDGATVDMKNVAEIKLPAPTESTTIVTNSSQIAILAPTRTPPTTEGISPASNQQNNNVMQKAGSADDMDNNPGNGISEPDAPATTNIRSRTTAQKIDSPKTVNIIKTDLQVVDNDELVKMDSLVDLATRKFPPTYPATARTARVAGIVKVEVVVDKEGSVAEVKTSEGPEMLRRAAAEAVKRWKFKPATRDGQPVRMSGFVNFNFTL